MYCAIGSSPIAGARKLQSTVLMRCPCLSEMIGGSKPKQMPLLQIMVRRQQTEADTAVAANTADASAANTANASVANTADVLVADANATDAAVAANAAPAGANYANMGDGGDWWRWRSSSCDKVDQNLRQCWECGRWDCKSCSSWCTRCPGKYLICGHCNAQDMYYLVRRGKTWRCERCESVRVRA